MKPVLKKTLPFPMHLLLWLPLSCLVTGVVLWIQPVDILAFLSNMLRLQPHLLLLNWLPIALTGLALTFLLQNAFLGGALTTLVWGGLSVANRMKIILRDEPVYPSDLTMVKEACDAMGSYHITVPWLQMGAVLVLTVLLLALGCFCSVPATGKGKRLLLRLAGFGTTAGVLAVLIATLYASPTLYQSFHCGNFYHITVVYNQLGFPYCFCYNFSTYQIEKPEHYNRSEAAAWETRSQQTHLAPNTHVIFIMNEAFSDLTDHPVFTYSQADDPLVNFHALQQSDNALSGYILVPNFAGGTANTEFDVLTGIQTTMLSRSNTSSFRSFTRNLDSILRLFRADGYHTSFIHPGHDWFYNRENVYRWLGADSSCFLDQMENPQYKGSWVTDAYTAGLVKQEFEQAVAQGRTLCSLTVTIQNHMAYTADKYGDTPIPPVQVSVPLSQDVQTMLSVYIEGLRDADAMLGELTDYFSAAGEPVVLVFYGDHLPYLGDQGKGYGELGLDIAQGDTASDPLAGFRTPYLIWCNDAAARAIRLDQVRQSLDLPDGGTINAGYLGAAVVELTGREGESPWFDFLNQTRRELPCFRRGMGVTGQGAFFREVPQTLQPLVDKLENWTYYKIKHQNVQ